MARAVLLGAALAAVGALSGCALRTVAAQTSGLSIMEYNVENFFDDVHNGTEYREFDPSASGWDTELFNIKMQHIAQVLRAVVPNGPDIVALEEVENQNALQTLNATYLKGMGYHAYTTEPGRSAIVVGLLTRYPVTELLSHHVYVKGSEYLRDIMEAHIESDGTPLVLFVDHWKSKLGGDERTETERRAAAAVVARRIEALRAQSPSLDIVVVGDFNENWDEYARVHGAYATAFMPAASASGAAGGDEQPIYVSTDKSTVEHAGSDRVVLFTPWGESAAKGSYEYRHSWETIDNTMLAAPLFDGKGFDYDSFEVFAPDFLLRKDGSPNAWNTERASGYSDHLPVLLHLDRER
jgi:endonuclease/exonuclease/phosphatase family metal-dependent hydrolase